VSAEKRAELGLPHDVLQRASLSGNEYAWPIEDIPTVIEAARQANLISIGGQLQFRLPDATCECYWVEVDTYKTVSAALPWPERVNQAAAAALADFSRLLSRFDFVVEGCRTFAAVADYFKRFKAEGGDPTRAMCFVWYVDDGESSVESGGSKPF
jgi:hypothetical protein